MSSPTDAVPIVPTLAPDLASVVRLGLVRAEPVAVGPSGPEIEAEIEELRARLSAEHAGKPPAAIPDLAPARDLYRAFGIDPTRIRPSSEALLRRTLQGKPLPRILNAVDLCNLFALRFLLPIGLYDTAALRGPVALRRGRPGEWYEGIRKEEVHLEGRPVLADGTGPFGNPTSDSLRTAVSAATRSLWMVIFTPAGYPADRLASHVRLACGSLARHLAPAGGATGTSGLVVPKADAGP